MASKTEELQKIIRIYKQRTGKKAIDLHEVARFAASELNYHLAEPADPIDILAKDLARAAREETRRDEKTGRPYRVNHAVPAPGGQFTFWVDIDENPPRKHMVKSLTNRREQMVDDGFSLWCDADHWSRINPDQEQIEIDFDLTFDIELRKHHLD